MIVGEQPAEGAFGETRLGPFCWSTRVWSRAGGVWKGSRGQTAGLEWWSHPLQDEGAGAFLCVVVKAFFLLLDFGLFFVTRAHLFFFFSCD